MTYVYYWCMETVKVSHDHKKYHLHSSLWKIAFPFSEVLYIRVDMSGTFLNGLEC